MGLGALSWLNHGEYTLLVPVQTAGGARSSKINANLYLVSIINVPKYKKNQFTKTIVFLLKPTCLHLLFLYCLQMSTPTPLP